MPGIELSNPKRFKTGFAGNLLARFSKYAFAQKSEKHYDLQTENAAIQPKSKLFGAAAAFIDQRVALGRVAFPLADLVKETGLSVTAARHQLLRLEKRVMRVSPRQPFYLIVGPEHRAVGAPPVAWWLYDYFAWLRQPYYLALQSAASLFGSNPQALQVTQVMTKSPRRTIEVGRIRSSRTGCHPTCSLCCPS